MRIVAISDTHGKHNQLQLPAGDILVHCGDWSRMGKHHEVIDFFKWFRRQSGFKHRLFIAGNHDLSFERELDFKNEMLKEYGELIYLEESGVEIDGVNFWGSPWTPYFHGWAFNFNEGKSGHFQAEAHWKRIPEGTNVLITHGPSHDILDRCDNDGHFAGSRELSKRIVEVQPDYHLFGHVHEGYGENPWTLAPTDCINCSVCNLQYMPVNAPVTLEM